MSSGSSSVSAFMNSIIVHVVKGTMRAERVLNPLLPVQMYGDENNSLQFFCKPHQQWLPYIQRPLPPVPSLTPCPRLHPTESLFLISNPNPSSVPRCDRTTCRITSHFLLSPTKEEHQSAHSVGTLTQFSLINP